MNRQIKLYAANISCNHCAMTIKRELAPVEGLVSVQVDVPTKAIDLTYTSDEALAKAKDVLADIGYPVKES